MNQIQKAFNACITLNAMASCTEAATTAAANDINGTIKAQTGTTILANSDATTPTITCFIITDTKSGHNGCIAFDKDGNTPSGERSLKANIEELDAVDNVTACASGVCTP